MTLVLRDTRPSPLNSDSCRFHAIANNIALLSSTPSDNHSYRRDQGPNIKRQVKRNEMPIITSSAVTYLHPRIGSLEGRAGQGSSNGARPLSLVQRECPPNVSGVGVPLSRGGSTRREESLLPRLVLSGCNCLVPFLAFACQSSAVCVLRRKRAFGRLGRLCFI